MSNNLSQDQILKIIENLNREMNVHLISEDFRSANYSNSSIKDILVQKISDEMNGEWTTDMAFQKIKKAISKVNGIHENDITLETDLNQLFPKNDRRKQIEKIGDELGIELDILKPNSVVYGLCIFLFFACIPFGIGMDWFLSGIGMIGLAVIIYILSKTGIQFKMKTVGDLSDDLAWKKYLKQDRKKPVLSDQEIETRVAGFIA